MLHTLHFAPYDPNEKIEPSENGNFALRDAAAFRWLHTAYFARGAQGQPLVPLNTERLDDAVDLTRGFKRLRATEQVQQGGEEFVVHRLRAEGGAMDLSRDSLKLLRDHWDAYARQFLGSSDAELVVAMRERFEAWEAEPEPEAPGE